jgi:hypothetical protein
VFVTRTIVPNGNDRCAAVIFSGLNVSPLVVFPVAPEWTTAIPDSTSRCCAVVVVLAEQTEIMAATAKLIIVASVLKNFIIWRSLAMWYNVGLPTDPRDCRETLNCLQKSTSTRSAFGFA